MPSSEEDPWMKLGRTTLESYAAGRPRDDPNLGRARTELLKDVTTNMPRSRSAPGANLRLIIRPPARISKRSSRSVGWIMRRRWLGRQLATARSAARAAKMAAWAAGIAALGAIGQIIVAALK